MYVVQRSVASSRRKATIQFADLKRRRYWFPLMVTSLFTSDLSISLYWHFLYPSKLHRTLTILRIQMVQIGIGLLVLQQLSGINGVLFYSSNIFKNAG